MSKSAQQLQVGPNQAYQYISEWLSEMLSDESICALCIAWLCVIERPV